MTYKFKADVWTEETKQDRQLVSEFREECNDFSDEIDPEQELDWHSLTIGWAIGKGLRARAARAFARYIRYRTDLG